MRSAPCSTPSRFFDLSRLEVALAVALRLATAVVLGVGGYGAAPPNEARAAQDPVSIQGEPCFTGMNPNGVTPLLITLKNVGPGLDSASVIVRSESGNGAAHRYEYGPISLPTGSVKQLVAYPALESYVQGVTVSLVGRFRTRQAPVLGLLRGGGGDGRQVGYIGDRVGGLASVRSLREAGGGPGLGIPSSGVNTQIEKSPLNDCYAKPEAAPDRAAGYNGLSTLVVGDGAERLSASQWAAIRQWTLGGGALIFTGGASAPQTRVADAAPLIPVQRLRSFTFDHLEAGEIASGSGAVPPGAIAILSGPLKAGAVTVVEQGGQAIIAKMPVGAGSSTLLAFNPFEKPLRGWKGQVGLWQGVIRLSAPSLNQASLRQVIQSREAFTDTRYGASPPGPAGSAARSNPFRVQLPPTSIIIYLFLAYFILVVPVSYFVLKRFRRMEWAWFTSPLLAVLFAYGFYLFTAELYKAGLSQRTAGVVIADAGLGGDARFIGFTELFFPRGGVYQIRIPGCELLEQSDVQQDYYYGSSGGQMSVLETIDNGIETVAPDFGVGNLAFRRLYHAEAVPWGRGLRADIRRGPASARGTERSYTGKITNGTGQTLKGVALVLPSTTGTASVERGGRRGAIPDAFDFVQLGDIAPGETKTIGKILSSTRNNGRAEARKGALAAIYQALTQGNGRSDETASHNGALLVAQTSGAAFGPGTLGRSVGGDQSVLALVAVPVR